jgi:hypothetical protein
VRVVPQFFLPFYGEGLYEVEEYATCRRAVGSIRNIAPHVGCFLGFLCFELFRRDRRAVTMMLIMALGFAVSFSVGGYWQTFNDSELRLSWWKNWEMTIGLGGGLAFGLAFYLLNRAEKREESRLDTRKGRIWGIGLPLWFGCGVVLTGACEGFGKLHGLEWFGWVRLVVAVVYLLLATAIYIWWIVRTVRLTDAELAQAAVGTAPGRLLVGVLVLIVLAGYATSIPPELRLANRVLLALYTVYILGSLALFGVLRWRRRAACGC